MAQLNPTYHCVYFSRSKIQTCINKQKPRIQVRVRLCQLLPSRIGEMTRPTVCAHARYKFCVNLAGSQQKPAFSPSYILGKGYEAGVDSFRMQAGSKAPGVCIFCQAST